MFGEVHEKLVKLGAKYLVHPSQVDRFADEAVALLESSHEYRDLAWKKKLLGRQVGKQGQRIYELRCQLAEARSFITVNASEYRNMRDQLMTALKQILKLRTENRELKTQLKVETHAPGVALGGLEPVYDAIHDAVGTA